jgi:gluconate 2-dehydrogenase gamma chain
MDRRKYLKTLVVGTAGAGTLLQSCGKDEKQQPVEAQKEFAYDRTAEELKREQKLMSEKFFTDHERKTVEILVDIIIPKDDVSGSATDAGVPDFIEFIMKDMPRNQLPVRGGLKWLDVQCLKRYNADFASCTNEQQLAMVDEIAYPAKAKPEMAFGVEFFNLMRDLTASGFFSSKIGIKDIGYVGNTPNQWDGVPQEVLDQYGLKYDARTLEICVKHNT